jgi:hypothetical protein
MKSSFQNFTNKSGFNTICRPFSFLAAFLLSTSVFAASIFVAPTEAVNTTASESNVVRELIINTVNGLPGYQSGTQAESKLALKSKLLKLGQSYSLTLEKWDGNKVLYASSMKSVNFESIDGVARRLTQTVIEERSSETTASVKDLTDDATKQGLKRRDPVNRWVLGFGPVTGQNVGAIFNSIGHFLAYEWEVPASSAAVKVGFLTTSNILTGFLDGTYFFTDTDTSPYVSAGFGYGTSLLRPESGNNEWNAGFAVVAGAGVRFFRTSTFNMELGTYLQTLLSRNSVGVPYGGGVRLTILFATGGKKS